jgi:hypothetical protein
LRLLLDAHVSGRSVGRPLRESGHDVRALDAEPTLSALPDRDVLALAAADERVLVTFDKGDFTVILREWGVAHRPHTGVMLVYGLRHHEFGRILRAIERKLQRWPLQDEWVNLVVVVTPVDAQD